jgi:hypothetical protein
MNDDDRIPDSAAISAACLALFLALLLGCIVWGAMQ